MSTTDDKTKEIADDAGETPSPESETDETENSDIGFPTLFLIIGFAVAMIFGWIIFPELLFSKQHQPIDFNHVMHNELVDNGCESCHFLREDGTFSGAPKLAQCIECHDEVQGDSKDEAIFVEEYVSKGREAPVWVALLPMMGDPTQCDRPCVGPDWTWGMRPVTYGPAAVRYSPSLIWRRDSQVCESLWR